MKAKESHEAQPEMQKKVVESHIGLSDGDDLEKDRQRLLSARHRESLIKPDARRANLIQIKAQRHQDKRQDDQSSQPATRLIETRQQSLRSTRGRRDRHISGTAHVTG